MNRAILCFVSAYQINTVPFSVLYQLNTQYHIKIPNTFSFLCARIFKKYILNYEFMQQNDKLVLFPTISS